MPRLQLQRRRRRRGRVLVPSLGRSRRCDNGTLSRLLRPAGRRPSLYSFGDQAGRPPFPPDLRRRLCLRRDGSHGLSVRTSHPSGWLLEPPTERRRPCRLTCAGKLHSNWSGSRTSKATPSSGLKALTTRRWKCCSPPAPRMRLQPSSSAGSAQGVSSHTRSWRCNSPRAEERSVAALTGCCGVFPNRKEELCQRHNPPPSHSSSVTTAAPNGAAKRTRHDAAPSTSALIAVRS